MNKKFVSQYSFSTEDDTGIELLSALRAQLAELKGEPLRSVYTAFGLVPAGIISDTDYLNRVDIVRMTHRTRTTPPYGYFVLATNTTGSAHTLLWLAIAKKLAPHVRLDYISSNNAGQKACGPLFVPQNLVNCRPAPETRGE